MDHDARHDATLGLGQAEASSPTPEVVCGADRTSDGDSVRPVAALYVDVARGPYASMLGVDAWGVERDATRYDGPHPVVAHPPCGHWGALGWASHDDGATGPVAVDQVRRFGGVLEHPAKSRLWKACGMPRPGWIPDEWGGYTIEVRQCDWGHRAEKLTWLFIVGCPPARLPACPPARLPERRRTTSRLARCQSVKLACRGCPNYPNANAT